MPVGESLCWLAARTLYHRTPEYALLNEKPYQPGYDKAMTNLVAQLRQAGVTSPDGIRLLCQYGITHVYVGQGQGRIAMPPPEPMLSISELESSPHFTSLYRHDKAGVFVFDSQQCSSGFGGGLDSCLSYQKGTLSPEKIVFLDGWPSLSKYLSILKTPVWSRPLSNWESFKDLPPASGETASSLRFAGTGPRMVLPGALHGVDVYQGTVCDSLLPDFQSVGDGSIAAMGREIIQELDEDLCTLLCVRSHPETEDLRPLNCSQTSSQPGERNSRFAQNFPATSLQ
jgi:hypothetical protein